MTWKNFIYQLSIADQNHQLII